jgi:hypothetical protein
MVSSINGGLVECSALVKPAADPNAAPINLPPQAPHAACARRPTESGMGADHTVCHAFTSHGLFANKTVSASAFEVLS